MTHSEIANLLYSIQCTEKALIELCEARLKNLGTPHYSFELDKQINALKDELAYKSECYVKDDHTIDKQTYLATRNKFEGADDFRASLIYLGY